MITRMEWYGKKNPSTPKGFIDRYLVLVLLYFIYQTYSLLPVTMRMTSESMSGNLVF